MSIIFRLANLFLYEIYISEICFPPFRPSYAQGGTEVNRRKKRGTVHKLDSPPLVFSVFPGKQDGNTDLNDGVFRHLPKGGQESAFKARIAPSVCLASWMDAMLYIKIALYLL